MVVKELTLILSNNLTPPAEESNFDLRSLEERIKELEEDKITIAGPEGKPIKIFNSDFSSKGEYDAYLDLHAREGISDLSLISTPSLSISNMRLRELIC